MYSNLPLQFRGEKKSFLVECPSGQLPRVVNYPVPDSTHPRPGRGPTHMVHVGRRDVKYRAGSLEALHPFLAAGQYIQKRHNDTGALREPMSAQSDHEWMAGPSWSRRHGGSCLTSGRMREHLSQMQLEEDELFQPQTPPRVCPCTREDVPMVNSNGHGNVPPSRPCLWLACILNPAVAADSIAPLSGCSLRNMQPLRFIGAAFPAVPRLESRRSRFRLRDVPQCPKNKLNGAHAAVHVQFPPRLGLAAFADTISATHGGLDRVL
ncbi:hypothetical protein DFH09DRAFT_1082066 [Mycena vulgaris]|nr:hypothetical protein DFH09DRAFT_1082066 [Mycena vulgaris]